MTANGEWLSLVSLPTASWDLISFFTNSQSYAVTAGGALITLFGTIMVIVAAVLIGKKLMVTQDQGSWFKYILLLLVGGAMMAGGFTLMALVSSGGKKTIEDLGTGGFVILQSAPAYVSGLLGR